MIYEPILTSDLNVKPKGYHKRRTLEKKSLAEDPTKRTCPVCSVPAKLVEHPRGEAFRCPKCRLVFGARPKLPLQTMRQGAVSVGIILRKARKENHKRHALQRQAEDYQDPIYREAMIEKVKRSQEKKSRNIT